MHGFRAVRRDVEFRAGGHQRFPHRASDVRGHVHFISELAREADPHHARRRARHRAFTIAHERERRIRKVDVVADLLQDLAAVRADHGKRRPVIRHGCKPHAHVRPLGLQPAFEPREHARRATRGGGHHVVLVGEAHGHAVVEDHAVLVEHQAIAALADFQLAPRIRVDPVQQLRRIGALNVDLAERRRVENADARAHRQRLARHRGMHVFARLRVVPGALPVADVFERRAVLHVPFVHCRLAYRIEELTQLAARKRAERDGRVVRTEGRRAGLGNRLAERLRENRHAVDVAELALIGAETHRCIALHVLDGFEAFARRQENIGRRHVVLEVDKLLRPTRREFAPANEPQRLHLRFGNLNHLHRIRPCNDVASCARRLDAGVDGEANALSQREIAGARANARLRLHRLARHKAGLVVMPMRLAARLREQMQHRAPATGHREQIAGQRGLLRTDLSVRIRRHIDRCDPQLAMRRRHRHTVHHFDAVAPCERGQRALRFIRARIDDRHLGTGRFQIERALIAVVVVREHYGIASRQHGIAMQVRRHRRSQHHARQIVVTEHDRPLMRPRCENHAFRANLPHQLARALSLRHRQMLGEPLCHSDEVMVLVTECRAAAQDLHIGHLPQFVLDLVDPLQRRFAVDLRAARQQRAAEFRLIVD